MRQGNWRNEAARFKKRREEYKETIQKIRFPSVQQNLDCDEVEGNQLSFEQIQDP